jgi:hypothetical protein
MPWCDACSKFWNETSMGPNGECPTCGDVVVAPPKGLPWHFKLMLVAFAGYMVYRVIWFIQWLPKHV